jgi:MATE family multidrug resistance protein
MSTLASRIRQELWPMVGLASPIVLGELGWMAMGVVDTLMVGRVGAAALGAMGIGRILFMAIAVCGIGLLLGLDTRIAQAYGAGNLRECNRQLVQGCYLGLALGLATLLALRLSLGLLERAELDDDVRGLLVPYTRAVSWSAPSLLVYTALRRYLQAVQLVRPVMLALVSANLVNAVANWILIFGHLGAPALGAAGAGWVTSLSMLYLALFLAVAVVLRGRERPDTWRGGVLRADRARIGGLLRLGLPAAVQLGLEVGVFALAAVLAGRLAAASLAAHQVALTIASVTFMVPLGISSAAAVRVGHALGRSDAEHAARSGWTALALGAGFMSLAALALVLGPAPLMRLFTTERAVHEIGVRLLAVAAFFQLFDGIQVVATGALRGAGDTRRPMLWNLVGHWCVGLPLGWYLGFERGWGVVGLWVGLSTGLTLVGCVLLQVWRRRVRALRNAWPASPSRALC